MLGERIGAERGKVTSRWVLEGGDYRLWIAAPSRSSRESGSCTARVKQDGRGGEAIWNGFGIGRRPATAWEKFAASVAYQAQTTGRPRSSTTCWS